MCVLQANNRDTSCTHYAINGGGGTYLHLIRVLALGPRPQVLLLSIAYPPSWGSAESLGGWTGSLRLQKGMFTYVFNNVYMYVGVCASGR